MGRDCPHPRRGMRCPLVPRSPAGIRYERLKYLTMIVSHYYLYYSNSRGRICNICNPPVSLHVQDPLLENRRGYTRMRKRVGRKQHYMLKYTYRRVQQT